MTESDWQSNLLLDLVQPVAPGDYLLNKAKIAEAKALISAYEEMNEVGKQSHDELARELEQKIREGEKARELLLQLKSQSTLQVPQTRRPAIDYPSSISRIEEVPSYGPGSGHSQQPQYQQFQGTSNQQTRNYTPQVTVQPAASGSYHQYSPQQWTSGNPNVGQSKQYSQYSQQPIMQNSSTSYSPFGFPSDQGDYDNHSHPVAPTQDQRRGPSRQEYFHYGNSGSSQVQWQTYSPPQTIPVHTPGPSSQATYKSRPPKNTQQSSSTKIYPEATVRTVGQSQATAYSQGPLPHKTTNMATQSQLATALGPQTNASSSNSMPVAVASPNPTSTNPIANPNRNRASISNQNATYGASGSNSVPVASASPNPTFTNPIANPNGDRVSVSNQNATYGPSSSNSVSVAVAFPNPISANPIANPNGDRASGLSQNTTYGALSSNSVPMASPNPISTNTIANSNGDRASVLSQNTTYGVSSSNSVPMAVASPNPISTNTIANSNRNRASVSNQNATYGPSGSNSVPVAGASPNPTFTNPIANSNGDRVSVSNQNATYGPSSSNSVSVAVASPDPISTNPIANPNNGDRASLSNQNATYASYSLSHEPTTLPSIHMNHIRFIHEFKEAIKNWDAKVPPNSYFDHPSNYFRVYKDLNGVTRIIMRGQGHLQGQSQIVDIDEFCDWIRHRNTSTSAAPAVPANPQAGASSSTSTPSNAQKAIPSTIHKAIPSTAVKANVQATSSATPHRPGCPEPGASFSNQTSSTMSSSTENQGIARQMAMPSAPPQTESSSFQTQLSTSISVGQSSLAQTPSSASVSKTPSRRLLTIVNGVPRSAEQANKKFLASHILFGLGKRRRETETSPAASTEPQPKRHHAQQQAPGQIVAGVSPFVSYTVGQATPTVQKPNLPNGASSSLQRPFQHNFIPFIPPMIPGETQQISQTSSASLGDRQRPANVTLEFPSTSKAATAVEVLEVSKTPDDQQQPVNATLEVPSAIKAAAAVEVPEVSKTPGNQQQPLNVTLEVPSTSKAAAAIEVPELSITPGNQQQPVNVTLGVPSTSKVGAAVDIPEVSKSSLSLQDARIVPLATSSTVVQMSTLPSSAPLAVPVPVPPLLESGKIPESIASTVLKQPQAITPAKLQLSFTGVPALGTSAEMPQKNQPLFLPSPVSSPGMDANDDDVSIPGTRSANVASRSFDLRKFSSSAKRKNHAFVMVPRRPPYLVKYFQLKKTEDS